MLSEQSSMAETAPHNFEAIEKAVMESPRGRWFLDEYVRRRTVADGHSVLTALGKIENAVASHQELIAERLGKVFEIISSVDSKISSLPAKPESRPVELTPEHMKFFKQDEELFEVPSKPSVDPARKASPSKPDGAKGARLVIKQQQEPSIEGVAAPLEPVAEISQPASAACIAEALPKSRIVVIRHKTGETLDVPLHDEFRASA